MLKNSQRFHWALVLLVGILGAILYWNTQTKIQRFEARQHALMSAQVKAAKREIESKLSQLQQQAALFVEEQRALLIKAMNTPDAQAHRQLQQKVARYFPANVGFTFATSKGALFFKPPAHPMSPECQQDLLKFSASSGSRPGSHITRIHPTAKALGLGRHFDVITAGPVTDRMPQGIFLVSLSDEYLARAMRNYEVNGNPLMLVETDDLHALQGRSKQRVFATGSNFRLSSADLNSILARASIANTHWQLIALPNPVYFAAGRQAVRRDAYWMGGTMLAVILLLVWMNRRESHRHQIESGKINEKFGAEILKHERTEASLHELSLYDVLTGLANRETAINFLGHIISNAERSGRHAVVLFIDIDHFRNIIESMGPDCGDMLLKEAAQRLKRHVRRGDLIARWGEDEFVIVLFEGAGPRQASQIAKTLLNVMQTPFKIGTRELTATASIGIAPYPEAGLEVDTLLKNAQTAMSRAKQVGRNNYCFFNPEMNVAFQSRMHLEDELRTAVAHAQFVLYYQPRFDTQTGKLKGAEALLRWQHPAHGLLLPGDFLDVLEETGLIDPVGIWIMQTVSQHAQQLCVAQNPEFRVAFNLTGREFSMPGLISRASQYLDTGIRSNLDVEINEGFLMAHTAENLVKLHALKQLGLELAIDDFGTGHSSLAYLRRFPINVLKIDRSFVGGLPDDANDAALSNTIIQLAHNLELHVVAVGVESPAQLEFLKHHQCDEVQGFLLGKPVPFQTFLDSY